MKRFALEKLIEWKDKQNRKPLIIRGARQVGKTWLMKEFGRICFEKVAYVNFDNNKKDFIGNQYRDRSFYRCKKYFIDI